MYKEVTFKITGRSPILMNNPANTMSGGGDELKAKKQKYDDVEEAEKRLYKLKSGQLYIEANCFKQSIVGKGGSATGRKFGKIAANTIVAGAVLIKPGEQKCPLFRPNSKKKITTYDEIDCRRVVVVNAGIIRARPLISEWECFVAYIVDTDFITSEQLFELQVLAGKLSGVMDFRPSRKGSFGMYDVKMVK